MTDPKRLACVSIHRERRAVQLTNYGQRLAARARQVLDVCSTARAEMRAILRKRLLLASCRLLAFLLDRSYISYQRPHCGSGSSPEWPSYIGTGDHVADRCAATGEGKADEIDRVLRRVPAYLLKDIAGDDDATTFEALRASSGGAIVCARPRPLRKRHGRVPATAVSGSPLGPCFRLQDVRRSVGAALAVSLLRRGAAVIDPTETPRGRRTVLLMPCCLIMAAIRLSCGHSR